MRAWRIFGEARPLRSIIPKQNIRVEDVFIFIFIICVSQSEMETLLGRLANIKNCIVLSKLKKVENFRDIGNDRSINQSHDIRNKGKHMDFRA